jgi:hypothetical protein
MRTLLGLPPLGLILGFMVGAGVSLSSELLPVFAVVCLAYLSLALIEVPEAAYEHTARRRADEERRWAEARAATHRA